MTEPAASAPSLAELRTLLTQAYADAENMRRAHVDANKAAWSAYTAHQAALGRITDLQAQIDAAAEVLTVAPTNSAGQPA